MSGYGDNNPGASRPTQHPGQGPVHASRAAAHGEEAPFVGGNIAANINHPLPPPVADCQDTPSDHGPLIPSKTINLLTVVDTEFIKQNYQSPQNDPFNPLEIEGSSQYVYVTGSLPIEGQGTPTPHFHANIDDTIAISGVSIYNNSEDAVLVYGIRHDSADTVLATCIWPYTVTRPCAILPAPGCCGIVPAVHGPVTFHKIETRVQTSGTEHFDIMFALYTLSPNRKKQVLYGYFYWRTVIVQVA